MDSMSGLPMIKCSSCGVDIDILQLADHICVSAAEPSTAVATQSPPSSPPRPARSASPTPFKLDRAATLGGASFSNRPEGQAPSGRMRLPSRIDPNAANKPFVGLELSVANDNSDPRNRSLLSPAPPKSPFKMNRSVTAPVPAPRRRMAPPSPKFSSNMDSAFPRFPRSATPQSAKSQSQERQELMPREKYAEPSPLFAPRSPRINGGENVARRMDRIAPGPFDAKIEHRPSTASTFQSPVQEETSFGHRRTNTQGSLQSLGSTSRQRASVTSNASHASNYSTRSIGSPAQPKPGLIDSNAPLPPHPDTSETTEGIDAFLNRLRQDAGGSNHVRQGSKDRKQPPLRPRRPSDKDLPPDGTSSVQSTIGTSSPDRKPRERDSQTFLNSVLPKSLQPLPPLAISAFRNDASLNSLHTPSDSGLSDDSYASSGFRSAASSRSSPPGSEAGHSREASKISRTGYLDETVQRTASPDSYLELRTTPPRGPGSVARLNVPQPALRSFSPESTNGPESPMDPAIQMGIAFDRRPRQPSPAQNPASGLGRNNSKRLPSVESRRQDNRPLNKGNCRGCSKPIVGKSVKDSSGRLTGRYHKQCFVCRTCNDTFPTAEFYVFDNSPYCEHHYHELNGSLCAACDRGIEGQYLETDDHRKFHPRCFTCTTCRIVLRDDYFEVAGKRYCDRHAQYAAAPPQNYLGVGGYQPRMEKRRTRLMMMA